MVCTFIGIRPPRDEMDEQEDTQLSEPGLNNYRTMPRNLFVGGVEQDQLSGTDDDERIPTGSTEPARTTELEERTRVLEMAMGKILARLIPDEPLIPLLNRDAQLAALRDVQKSIDKLKSLRSHQQTLDLDSAPLNLSITAEPYQEGFKIPHLETYDGSSDPDEHLHTYQAIMRIQNANDAMMCKVFPATLKSTARRWYHKLPRHSIDSYSQLAKLFSNKFASQREIKRTVTELMQVHQKERESLRDYMQRFNKATLDIDNVPDTICLSALLHGLKCGRFLDDLLENPPTGWPASYCQKTSSRPSDELTISRAKARNNHRGEKKRKSKRSQILAQIQHWVRRPPPPLHDSPRADKSKHCDYHRVYGHNTKDCQHLKDELEFLARNGKLEGYVQKLHAQQPTQAHFVQGAYRGRQFNRRGQGQRTTTQNQKDRKMVDYAGIAPPSGIINMISGGMHSGGQSARGRKAYACQVMTVNKNRPLKRSFEEAEWENMPITFSPADYKRAEREPDVMMPHVDPFVATVHIGNHNVNKVFIDIGSSLDILYWNCFQKMQLNPGSLQKYEGPIYGFDNQPVPVEGVITLPIYVGSEPCFRVGSEPRFRMASVNFLVVKMELAFNAILGRATLCELKAVISQPHLYMKFPTPQGTMSISDIEHRPEGVEQKAKSVEPVDTVPLNPDVPERTVKIGTKLTEKERAELLEFLRDNQDVFAWTTDEMPGILAKLTVHKLSPDPTRKPVVQKRCLFGPEKQAAIDEEIQKLLQAGFIRRMEYSEWVSNPVLVKKPNGKWRMCIDFTNLNDACPKDPHPLPNVEKLVELAARHEQMSFLDASSESGKFLGYMVSKKGIEVNPEKFQAVQQMESPRTVKDVQRLTSRVAALHRFIARSAERCLPFFKALREPKNFQWTNECQWAFDELKQYLASAPLLSKPIEGESLYLYLGVTEEAVSSVLLREENKHQKPICYVSKVLQGAEQNYPLAEKATFSLVYTAQKLRAYFQSHQVVVYTDLPLRKILQKRELSGWLIEWSVELSEYDLKFQPRTTLKGQAVADFLVECTSTTVEQKAPEHPVWVLYVDGAANVEGSGAGAVLVGPDGFKSEYALRLKSIFASFQIDKIPRADNQRADELSKLASSQETNPHRSIIVEVLDAPSYTDSTVECQLLSTDPSSPSWTTPLINYLQSGELPEDPSTAKLIKHKATHFTLLDNQLYKRAVSMPLLRCLTPYEAEYVVREVHEGVCGTHIGGEMLSSLSSPWPFAQWGVDLLGPFVKGKGGCTYLVVAVDYFTKWIKAKPLSTTTEKKVEEFLFNSILCRFGIPKRIIAHNGLQFRATALRSFCNNYGIELSLTSVYTPQSNGQAESANKIVLRGLKTRVLVAHSNWVDELNKVLWSCRTTPSSAIGETPFSLAYGAKAVIPVEVGLPSNRSDRHNDLNNEKLLRENLDLVEEVREMS
ncbi:hypothetical protein SLEP1_g47305 [Rubroshorea leprosula]|uniref:Integrase catalytic domain-containing protein n=1 Tax=Rubroshorea leprosula TaxID=152421 RepID=A0AAV5LSN3_9ROSI|nr:hypothetical protein SLEP1_g47305 [Rubroshorea leprosula]